MFQIHADWMRVATRTEPIELPTHDKLARMSRENGLRRGNSRLFRWFRGRKSKI